MINWKGYINRDRKETYPWTTVRPGTKNTYALVLTSTSRRGSGDGGTEGLGTESERGVPQNVSLYTSHIKLYTCHIKLYTCDINNYWFERGVSVEPGPLYVEFVRLLGTNLPGSLLRTSSGPSLNTLVVNSSFKVLESMDLPPDLTSPLPQTHLSRDSHRVDTIPYTVLLLISPGIFRTLRS